MSKTVAVVVKYFPALSQTFIVNQMNSLITAGYNVQIFAYKNPQKSIIHESLHHHDLMSRVIYFVKPSSSKILRSLQLLKWVGKHAFKLRWRVFFKTLNFFKYGKDAYTLKLFFEAQWFLVPNDIWLIHTHFGMNGERMAYLKAHNIIPNHIPLINTFHGYDLTPNELDEYPQRYKHLFKLASAFTVNTPYLGDLLSKANKKATPVYILPVGLDTQYFKPKQYVSKKHKFQLVFCGNLIALKGPDIAIEILETLHFRRYKHVYLTLIGAGPMLRELQNLVKCLNLEPYVTFTGALTQSCIKEQFNKSDVFVLPGRLDPKTGRAETQGLVIQEAQAMELPVVVSDAGGMRFGMLNGETGFVVKSEDVSSFVDVLEKLILDQALRLKMGQAGRNFVVKNYDNKVLVKRLKTIYETVNEP